VMRAFLWMLVLLAFPSMVLSATYTVPIDGPLQEVINLSVSGDTIYVDSGTYTGNFYIENNIPLYPHLFCMYQ